MNNTTLKEDIELAIIFIEYGAISAGLAILRIAIK
jgi:hypothetical protein